MSDEPQDAPEEHGTPEGHGSDRHGPEGPRPPQPSLYRTAWGLYLFLAIAGILWLGARHGRLPLSIFLVPSALAADVLWGLGIGVALLAGWWLTAKAIPGVRRLEDQLASVLVGIDRSEAVALALISGFAEELFFRGAMQQSWGYWPTVVVFGILHTGPGRSFLWWTAFALGAGALFGWMVLERGTLLPAVLAHMVVNGVNLWRLASRESEVDAARG